MSPEENNVVSNEEVLETADESVEPMIDENITAEELDALDSDESDQPREEDGE
jgi:hypothetical protein